MITLITGTPGAGKTLYAIEKLLLPLVGTHIAQEVDGVTTMHPRTIYTNINGLQIDHELIDGGDNEGLQDWYTWAKPGSVIVFDEVQKVWPPRPNGSKIPLDVQELDTHRHKGVDFILITQSVMNIDRHLHALGGRHLHVRRVGNMKFAVVYEWDHVSKSLQYSKSISKTPWRYSKKVFKLYKSAELHTKQKRSTPPLLWISLLAMGVAAYGIPSYMQHIKDKTNVAQVSAPPKDSPPAPATLVAQADQKTAVEAPVKPKIAGCISTPTRCECFTDTGEKIEPEAGYCQSSTAPKPFILAGGSLDWYPDPPPPPPRPQWDGSVIGTQKGWRF